MIALSPDGKLLGAATPRGVTLLPLDRGGVREIELEAAPRRLLVFDDQVWIFDEVSEGARLRRYTSQGLPLGAAQIFEGMEAATASASGGGPAAAVLRGRRALGLRDDCGELRMVECGAALGCIVPVGPRSWIVGDEDGLRLRRPDEEELRLALPMDLRDGRVAGGCGLFDGGAALLEVRDAGSEVTLLVVELRHGGIRHRLRVDEPSVLRVAQRRGHAVLLMGDGRLMILDLRFGRRLKEWHEERPLLDLAIDAEGSRLVFERRGAAGEPALEVLRYRDLFTSERREAREEIERTTVARPAEEAAPDASDEGAGEGAGAELAEGAGESEPPVLQSTSQGVVRALVAEPEPGPIDLQALLRAPLLALLPRSLPRDPAAEEAARMSPGERLEPCLEVVAAWCKRAIALGWDSGRLSAALPSESPFEREVGAILDGNRGYAAEQLARSVQRAEELERAHDDRRTARGAGLADDAPALAGTSLDELAREFRLSPLAADILLVAAAPLLWGELARTYGILANDPARPLCDELLVAQLLGPGRASRRELARELDSDGPLVRHGLLRVGSGARPFASLAVPEVVVARLWGERFERDVGGTIGLRGSLAADRSLSELWVPRTLLVSLVETMKRLSTTGHLRLVLHGRLGSGRRTLLAALAARAGRPLGVIELSSLLHLPQPSEALGASLREAWLRGWLPCVSGAERLDPTQSTSWESFRAVLRTHAGPLVFRAAPDAALPLDPDHASFVLPPLSETERAQVWRDALARRSLPGADADDLAARHRLGPGTIHRVVEQVAALPALPDDELSARLEAAIRQHRHARLSTVATRIERLAPWSSVVLPDELTDSLREFIGRIQHRRTVFERWGFDRVVTSARGLTALFQGGPGTGKSMVAGAIARELGYELYRIDLGRVLSKWIGETEKSLGAVFDAAEEGEVVLLFDEADSLFGKRTEVRSSVDRYANVEVNYLLQRLDSFEGVAVLTTNFGTAIDAAFKRRLSLRMSFPFPDAEMRERLWRVHLPPELPIAGELDLARLAQKYQLSGGYIRNASLRAAFLAAREDRPVSQEHLERAIKLEYREMGNLFEGGVLE